MKNTWKFVGASGETADLVTYSDNGTDTTVAQILGQLQNTLATINGRLQQLESDTATTTATPNDYEERISKLEDEVFAEVLGVVQTATGGGYGVWTVKD